jgi:hypothetical protein
VTAPPPSQTPGTTLPPPGNPLVPVAPVPAPAPAPGVVGSGSSTIGTPAPKR